MANAEQRRVTDVRFSPDTGYLAVASADAGICIYRIDEAGACSPQARCYGHSSAVKHLDFSTGSDVLRSNDQGHELRFWDVPSGQPITEGGKVCRDLPWASFRVTLGYHCQGVYRGAADGSSVQAIDRSSDQALLATVDNLGQVHLFRNPCVVPEAPGEPNRRSYNAHASAALDCHFAGSNDELVVTVGGSRTV